MLKFRNVIESLPNTRANKIGEFDYLKALVIYTYWCPHRAPPFLLFCTLPISSCPIFRPKYLYHSMKDIFDISYLYQSHNWPIFSIASFRADTCACRLFSPARGSYKEFDEDDQNASPYHIPSKGPERHQIHTTPCHIWLMSGLVTCWLSDSLTALIHDVELDLSITM